MHDMPNQTETPTDSARPVHEIANRFLAIGLKRAIAEMLELASGSVDP
jgi:hypothetical protein